MLKLLASVVVLLGMARLGSSQMMTLNITNLIAALDRDYNKTVTPQEVDSFYTNWPCVGINCMISATWDKEAMSTRCNFLERMAQYSGSPAKLSVMFDLMQDTEDSEDLTMAEFRTAILGSPNMSVPVATVRDNLQKLLTRVDEIYNKPYLNTNGASFWKYSEFQASRLADNVDNNRDGIISRDEVSRAMRAMSFEDDWAIYRCEFVVSMKEYKLHLVTASKLYDLIFSSRDVTWADVDSDFLMSMMEENEDGTITKKEFIDFFTLQNQLAAGVPMNSEGGVLDVGDSASAIYTSIFLIASSLFVHLVL